MIQSVLNSRRLGQESKQPGCKYALIGAAAIHFEMVALRMHPVPPVRTIHKWIQQSDLASRSHAAPELEKESKPCPTPKRDAINALYQLDLR